MSSFLKDALSLDEYKKYDISQYYTAYKIQLLDIGDRRCDDFEYELSQKYKIFHIDIVRNKKLFNFTAIVGESKICY